jgi:hypothetical protein
VRRSYRMMKGPRGIPGELPRGGGGMRKSCVSPTLKPANL